MKKLSFITEEQVLDALNIESFRNLSKDKVMEFVSLIPEMDKDVAISIINQFPAYVESAKAMIEKMTALCETILKENRESLNDAVTAYKKILEDLSNVLERKDVSAEEREQITIKMIDIADKIAEKDTENKEFLKEVLHYGTTVICGVVLLGVVILGVRFKGIGLPKVA